MRLKKWESWWKRVLDLRRKYVKRQLCNISWGYTLVWTRHWTWSVFEEHWEKFQRKKYVLSLLILYSFMYYFCLDFKEVCHYIFPPMIWWNSQEHKLETRALETIVQETEMGLEWISFGQFTFYISNCSGKTKTLCSQNYKNNKY